MIRIFGLAAVAVMAGALASFGAGSSAQAQLFCQPNSNANQNLQTGGTASYSLQNGACTNGINGSGAFSGASLASQALSNLTQSTTTETNRQTSNAVAGRRAEEEARCPPGQVRTGSGCEVARARRPVAASRTEMTRTRVVSMKKGKRVVTTKMVRKRVPVLVETPEPIPMLIAGPRFGAFAQGFGDYERRSGTSVASISYNSGAGGVIAAGNPGAGLFVPPGVNIFPIIVQQQASTKTAGFVGGIDMTFRNNISLGDGAIFGLLVGYTDTSIRINSQLTPTSPLVLPGASSTQVTVRGPSVGMYASYFNGPFSIDHTLKLDFFRLNENFAEVLGFGGTSGPVNGTVIGTAGTNVAQVSSIGNANYKFLLTPFFFIEPTVGYQYTASFYEASAAQLGLRDGDLLRIQGGARFGFTDLPFFGPGRLSITLTGLAYENVFINGGFIQAGAFGSNALALNDARKLRGEGIFNVAYDFGNGLSTFAQAQVRGGSNYFGVGGKGGIRYQW